MGVVAICYPRVGGTARDVATGINRLGNDDVARFWLIIPSHEALSLL
jgi:hypothetical protein